MSALPGLGETHPAIVRRPPVVGSAADQPCVGTGRRAASGSEVRVRLSPAGLEALARSEVAPRVLDRVAEALGLEIDALNAVGREEYLESIATPLDPRAEDPSEPILGGILGFVYDAFRLDHPKPSQHELRGFVSRAAEGIERGMRDAMKLLRAFSSRRAEFEAESARTLQRVRSGLDRFAERMRSTPASEDDAGGTASLGAILSDR